MKVYGDLSGYLKTFLRLRERLPEGLDLALADLNDRGPSTPELIEWFIQNGKSILGNHEHMMLDFYKQITEGNEYQPIYRVGVWLGNGGDKTLLSYGIDQAEFYSRKALLEKIPKEHISYLENLPWYREEPGFIFTHAPILPRRNLDDLTKFKNMYELEASLLWNRILPKPKKDIIQIYGHNSAEDCLIFCKKNPKGIYLHKFLDYYGSLAENKEDIFAICLDTANRGGKISCLHLPTFTIHQEEIKED